MIERTGGFIACAPCFFPGHTLPPFTSTPIPDELRVDCQCIVQAGFNVERFNASLEQIFCEGDIWKNLDLPWMEETLIIEYAISEMCQIGAGFPPPAR